MPPSSPARHSSSTAARTFTDRAYGRPAARERPARRCRFAAAGSPREHCQRAIRWRTLADVNRRRSPHARVPRAFPSSPRHLQAAHAARSRFANLEGELAPHSVDEAYLVQQELVELWQEAGEGAGVGYKIALTSQAIRDLVGVSEPCAGTILANMVHHGPAEIRRDAFVRLGIEFELAVRMGRDVPGDRDAAGIRDFVDAVMPAFELIEDRDADYANLDANSLIADNAWCGGIVLGTATAGWRDLDLATVPVTLDYNGETETAVTGAAMGSPLASLAFLSNLLVRQGRPLRAGDVVMTGSTLATRFASAGDTARYAVEGVGSVELRVT